MKAKNKLILSGTVILMGVAATFLVAQQSDLTLNLSSHERPAIAVTDFRGTGDAQKYMDTFNGTLWDELANAGIFKMVAKTLYPLDVPQRPQDFRPPSAPAAPARPARNQPPPQPVRN